MEPSTFIDWTNPHLKEAQRVIQQRQRECEAQVYARFLDCLYAECGYIMWFERGDEPEDPRDEPCCEICYSDFLESPRRKCSKNHPSPFNGTCICNSREHAVKTKIENNEMGNVTKEDLKYLVRPNSAVKVLFVGIGMTIQAIARGMDGIVTSFSRRRREALQRAWTWLTGYETYEDCWKNPDDQRVLTSSGFSNDDIVGSDEEDDEVTEMEYEHGDDKDDYRHG